MSEKGSILIVDDDKDGGRSLSSILRRRGYETEAVGTGQQALEKAQERFFDLALLDLCLPDVEGVDLIAPLRKLQPDIAVILVTGYASMETAVQALNQGASAYIIKPLNIDCVGSA